MTREELIKDGLANGATPEQIKSELQRYRAEVGAFDDEREQPTSEPTKNVTQEEPGFGDKFLNGLKKAVETIDRFTGAPARALVGAGLGMIDEGKTIRDIDQAPVNAMKDPSTAPSGSDLVKSSYGEDAYNKSNFLKGLGTAADIFLDPSNLIPVGPLAKLGTTALKSKPMVGLGKMAKSLAGTGEDFIKGTAARVSKVDRNVLEDISQMGPGAMKDIKKATDTGEKTITGGRDLEAITAYRGGENLEKTVEAAEKAGKERFIEQERKYLTDSGVGEIKLLSDSMAEDILKIAKEKGGNIAKQYQQKLDVLKTLRKEMIDKEKEILKPGGYVHPMHKDVLNSQAEKYTTAIEDLNQLEKSILGQKKYDIAQSNKPYILESSKIQKYLGGGKNEAHKIALEEIEKATKTTLNQTKASPGEIRLLQEAADVSKNVKTVEDALKARRTIDESIKNYTKSFEGMGQFKGTTGEKALMNIRNGFNDLIEKKINTTIKDPGDAQKFINMFRENNKVAHEAISALSELKKGVNIAGKEENIGKNLLGIGYETLQKVKNASEKAPELKEVFKEVSNTIHDQMILKSIKQISGNSVFDPNTFKSLWKNLGEKKELLFDSKKIVETEKLLDLMSKGKALGLAGAGKFVTRSTTGLGALGGISGASAGGAEGGVTGALTGFALGMLGTSPAAAVAAYKLTNKTKSLGGKAYKGLGKLAKSELGARTALIGAKEMVRPNDENN